MKHRLTSRQIHIMKAFSWRFIASLTTLSIAWFITGDLEVGLKVGAVDVVLKLVFYYFHERAWYLGVERKVAAQEAKHATN